MGPPVCGGYGWLMVSTVPTCGGGAMNPRSRTGTSDKRAETVPEGWATVHQLHPEPDEAAPTPEPPSQDAPSPTVTLPHVDRQGPTPTGVNVWPAVRTVPTMIAAHNSPAGFLARALPLPGVPPAAPAPAEAPVAAVTTVDGCWRVRDASVFAALGWTTGTRVAFTTDAVGLRARTANDADTDTECATLDVRTRLLIPRGHRRGWGLRVGQPLFLLADPVAATLRLSTLSVVHTALENPQ